MGLLILILVGAVLGWLAAIVLRIEDGRGILTNIGLGTGGSLLSGIFGGSGSILGAVSGSALVWAVAGALVALAVFNVLRRRGSMEDAAE